MNQSPSGIALIVDIENIKISIALETAIVNLFPLSKIIKIAVGNWKLLKLDRELQDRGYHLFHVPTGNNNADREILNLSWLIKDYNELIIVSNDKIFIQFVHQFNSHNRTAYIIYRSNYKSEFIITKSQVLLIEETNLLPSSKSMISFESHPPSLIKKIAEVEAVMTANTSIQFTSQAQLIQTLKQLVIQNQNITTTESLASEFHRKFGIKASTAISSCRIPGSFNKFVTESRILENFHAKDELITNIRKIIKDYPYLAQDSGKMGHKFKQTYGISITEKMKQIGITGKSSQFVSQIQLDDSSEYN